MSLPTYDFAGARSPAVVASRFVAWIRRVDRATLVLVGLLALIGAFAPSQWPASVAFAAKALGGVSLVLVLSIGIAAAVNASGASALVAGAFVGRTATAIVLASAAGALSPLCSCGVVPLIAGMLAAGVPLAPVMAFWLASPLMDPAIFVLTAGAISMEFAVAKTLAALAVGLLGGGVTALLARQFDRASALRVQRAPRTADEWAQGRKAVVWQFWRSAERRAQFADAARAQARQLLPLMAIAFLLESLMVAWIPAEQIAQWLGDGGGWAIPLAVALGVPAYMNGVAAVPLVGGLIEMGMHPAVGLAFMTAGGVTSIPAALAVWALVRPRVFGLYLALGFAGSLMVAYAYAAWTA